MVSAQSFGKSMACVPCGVCAYLWPVTHEFVAISPLAIGSDHCLPTTPLRAWEVLERTRWPFSFVNFSFNISISLNTEADPQPGVGQLWYPCPQWLAPGWARDPSPANQELSPGCFCRSWRGASLCSLVRNRGTVDLEVTNSHGPSGAGHEVPERAL